jgi:hypothetical protein
MKTPINTECRDHLTRTDTTDQINQRNLPVAIFHGTHDKICPFDFAKVMNQGIVGSRLIELKEWARFEHRKKRENKRRTNGVCWLV